MRVGKFVPDRFATEKSTHLSGIWMGPKAGQDIFEMRKLVGPEVSRTVGS
jgi:hypothetical protein